MREGVLGSFFEFRAAFAQDPITDLVDELKTFFHDGLVSRLVHVIGGEAGLFQSVHELFGDQFTGLSAEFFTDGNTNGRRRVSNNELVGVIEHLHDFINKAHLFDRVEGASDQALAAGQASVFTDGVDNTQTTGDGVHRANFTACVATNAVVLVDLDHTAQFTATEVANVFRSVFSVRIGRRSKRIDHNRFGHV